MRRLGVVAIVALIGGCGSSSPTEVPGLGPDALTIDWPPAGAAVCSNIADAVYVTGHAPAGARVVHDISFAPDDEAVADASGEWGMPADANEGQNDLKFRIGDDHSTERTVSFSFERVDEMPHAGCVDAVGVGNVPSVTASPPLVLPSETFEALEVLTMSGTASAQGQFTDKTMTLAAGHYRLLWSAMEPFDPSAGGCGVTIYLYDSAGNSAGGVDGVSRFVSSPTNDSLDYPALLDGEYTASAYVGCPWSVELDRLMPSS